MHKTTQVLLGLAILLCFMGCPPENNCPADQANPDELIAQLKEKVTRDDVATTDIAYLCYTFSGPGRKSKTFIADTLRAGLGEFSYCDTLTLGNEKLLSGVNHLLFGPDYKRDTLEEVYIQRDCDCDPGLLLLYFESPDGLDINNGVAGSRTRAREQNNGVVGAIGINTPITFSPGEIPVLPPAQDSCGLLIVPPNIDRVKALNIWKDKKTSDKECLPTAIEPSNQRRGKVVKVAIIDTGVDPLYKYGNGTGTFSFDQLFHGEALANLNAVPPFTGPTTGSPFIGFDRCADLFGHDAINNDNNPSDRKGHGTHLAGTILSANGASPNTVKVSSLQFGDYVGYGDQLDFRCDLFAAICGLRHAIRNKADIINMSWGYYAAEPDPLLEQHIREAAAHDILMVTSVGNDSINVDDCPHWPSGFRDSVPNQLISVAALATPSSGNDIVLADYSNYGSSVDLAAPGTEIKSALAGRKDETVRLSGTSMAAAVISRQAAMLRYDQSGKRRTAKTIKGIIIGNCLTGSGLSTNNSKYYPLTADNSLPTAIGY